jgi:hypothetical protein
VPRPLHVVAGVALVLAGAALVGARRAAVPHAAVADAGLGPPAAARSPRSAGAPPAPASSRSTAPRPWPARAPAGDSPVLRVLTSFSPDELALFARFEELTGRPAPAAVADLVARRRAGATDDALVAEATRALRGDLLGRAAALEWIDRTRVR